MWTYDTYTDKWISTTDSISTVDFDYLKQSLESVALYSRALSGATYYPVNDLNNIYDILESYVPRSWYVTVTYSITSFPDQDARAISATSSDEYYNKYLPEYGLTLKNLFTPTRLINDSLDNFTYVDVCSTESINTIGQVVVGLAIDGITLLEGHRVLVKNQITYVTVLNSVDPTTYFYPTNYHLDPNQAVGSLDTSYYYYNELNGIYIYTNNTLVRESDLDVY